MKQLYPALSIIFSVLSFSVLFSLFQGGTWFRTLSFGTTGVAYMVFHIMYSVLALSFALLSPKSSYKIVMIFVSASLLLMTVTIAFIGIYGFQAP